MTGLSAMPELPDLANLRDLGGLPTRDSRSTRHRRLLRCATPFFLDAHQSAALVEGLGVRLRIDLRSRGEVPGATNPHLASVEQDVLWAPLGAGGPLAGTYSSPHASVAAHYAGFLRHGADSVAAVARSVADATRLPALIHCTLGKDRTGTVVAVLLSAVGVTNEAIIADYAASRGQTEALLDRLHELPGYSARLKSLPAEAFGADPASMGLFLSELDETYGGGRSYLSSIGVSDSQLDALQAQLVRMA
jgi:protein-tyrosine phosphatase